MPVTANVTLPYDPVQDQGETGLTVVVSASAFPITIEYTVNNGEEKYIASTAQAGAIQLSAYPGGTDGTVQWFAYYNNTVVNMGTLNVVYEKPPQALSLTEININADTSWVAGFSVNQAGSYGYNITLYVSGVNEGVITSGTFTVATGDTLGPRTLPIPVTTQIRQLVMSKMSTVRRAEVRFNVFLSDTLNGGYIDSHVNISQAAAPQIEDINITVDEGPETTGYYLQNIQDILVSPVVTVATGATAINKTVVVGSVTKINIPYEDDYFTTITDIGVVPVTVYVTDSRGFTGSYTKNIQVYAYNPVNIDTWTIERNALIPETIDISVSGTYSQVPDNTIYGATYNVFDTDGDPVDGGSLTFSASNGTFTATGTGLSNLNVKNTYTVRVLVVDEFSNDQTEYDIPAGMIIASVGPHISMVTFRENGVGIGNGIEADSNDNGGLIVSNDDNYYARIPKEIYRLSGGGPIVPDNGDLNNYTLPGQYLVAQAENLISNMPVQKTGVLTVIGALLAKYNASTSENTKVLRQEYVTVDGEHWERRIYPSSGVQTFGTWYRTLTTADSVGGTYYGVCGTGASTAAKTVTIAGITELTEGLQITVKFTNAQTASGVPTLNVNSLGAKNIRRNGSVNAGLYEWVAQEILNLVYDGTYWVIVDGGFATTTYYGVTKLSSATNSTSTALAATPSAVKAAYDLANGKQDPLTFDTTPTADSTNPVTSGGVYTEISGLSTDITDLQTRLGSSALGDLNSYTDNGVYMAQSVLLNSPSTTYTTYMVIVGATTNKSIIKQLCCGSTSNTWYTRYRRNDEWTAWTQV